MNIHLQLQPDQSPVCFRAENEDGVCITIDGSPEVGGQNHGPRPMQLLIMGLGGCSGIDLVNILKKQRIVVDFLRIDIRAERSEGVPALFSNIHVIYRFSSGMDPAKAQRAADLSIGKYCSVAKTLEATATLTHEVVIENAE